MAITGIDTIDGKQIIAAGAVSAKSAEMAYNDENGNPITGYLTAVPEGYATTADLTGKQDTLTFGYNESNAISSINESAIGGGSTPTYSYSDNGLISAIDTSGLYASSGSANHLRHDGTMGENVVQSYNGNNFYYMPLTSPFGKPQGIFSPLQYATGACLAMSGGSFGAYYKGNEWYISNQPIGQMLRGEVHQSRGVHISGATTAGHGFNLGILSVSGVNSTGSWKYGYQEDTALRAVSSCDMHESAFSYDASDNITAYNGSAFKAGDEFPQSATEAIETVTANSGAWGGSALPISAGVGVKISLQNDTLVFESDETLLYSSTSAVPSGQSFTLSESPTNFDSVKFYCIHNEANTGWNEIFEYRGDAIRYDIVLNATDNANDLIFDRYAFTRTDNNIAVGVRVRHVIGSTVSKASLANPLYISKVVGINRIAGGN